MWNRFLLTSREYRVQIVGALLTLSCLSLFATSCSSSSDTPEGGGGSGNPSAGHGGMGAGGAGPQCSTGTTACGSNCVNLTADNNNCGMCGKVCSGATPYCSSSQCIASCPTGTTTCPGACVNTQTDPTHCGSCTTACSANQACTAGVCTTTGAGGAGGMSSGGASGASGASGGTAMGGSGGGMVDTSRPDGCPAAPELLSDFEEGKGVLAKQGGRTGWWYVYVDMNNAGMQTPPNTTGPIAVEMLPATDTPPPGMCSKYALHSTAKGHPDYVGFGATFSPGATAAAKAAYSLADYTGVSFRIRSGSGSAPPIWFELLNKETQPADGGGVATNPDVDQYNTRGRLLSGITTSWQTITIPFSTLGPRYLPSGDVCGSGVFCEAPPFNPMTTLGLQFSLYDQFAPGVGAYDLWVDDVKLTKGDAGLPTVPGDGAKFPFPLDRPVMNGCVKPTGATGKVLVEAFQRWKKTFVTADGSNLRVKFDDPSATVSEGIAYGMLISVFMNDKATFDGLWGYWKAHASGDSYLMNWKIPGGNGSAIDADEDAAFALIQASKQWTGGSYSADAMTILGQIRSKELDSGTYAVKPGNSFSGGASSLTNPSYFAPAFYRVFAQFDTANAAAWNGAASTVYTYLNSIAGSNGLVPAWCTNSCASRGGGGYADADKYQYDSHRAPWRIGLDACWNGNADAKAYVMKTTSFFSSKAGMNLGLGDLSDEYQGDGSVCTACSHPPKRNSMSLIGTATVGAMAAGNQAFVDRGWHFLLDANYTADPTFAGGAMSAYTYYNATVGLLTALTLSGNFVNL